MQVHCQCSLEDGTEIDDRRLEFEVGARHVIQGLEVAVQNMGVGQLAEVTVPHLYGYGVRGHPPQVPARSTLILKLELLQVISKKGILGDGVQLRYVGR